MSDPHPVPGRKQPRRAEPLQPDLPGRGAGVESDDHPGESSAAEQQKKQSEDALANVREGYA